MTTRESALVELAWRALTDPEHCMRWWGPADFTSPLGPIGPRPGRTRPADHQAEAAPPPKQRRFRMCPFPSDRVVP